MPKANGSQQSNSLGGAHVRLHGHARQDPQRGTTLVSRILEARMGEELNPDQQRALDELDRRADALLATLESRRGHEIVFNDAVHAEAFRFFGFQFNLLASEIGKLRRDLRALRSEVQVARSEERDRTEHLIQEAGERMARAVQFFDEASQLGTDEDEGD